MSTANDAWQELKGEHPEAEQHWVFMAGYRQGLLDAASPALMAPSDELLKLADRWQYAADHATSSESRVSLLSAIADLCALFDAATPAASVPAADILALADEWERIIKYRDHSGELRALVAAAEQADKGEAADTPRDEWDCWCQGTAKGDPHYSHKDGCPDAPAVAPEPVCRCGHKKELHWNNGLVETRSCFEWDCFCSAFKATDTTPARVPVNDEAEAEPPAMVFLTDEERDYLAFHGVNLHTPPCEQCPEAQAAIESVLAARLAGFRAARGEDA